MYVLLTFDDKVEIVLNCYLYKSCVNFSILISSVQTFNVNLTPV